MSFFRGRSQPQQAAQLPTYTGLQLPTATSTLPLTLAYGRNKTGVNVIFYAGFTAVPEFSAQQSGGKGGNTGGVQIVGWFYLADLLLALCEGPIDSIGNVYKGQAVFPFSQMGTTLFRGTDTQTNWSYIDSRYPGKGLGYKKTCYLGCPQYYLGESASIGSLNLEILALLYGTGFNGEDADPGEMIIDYLTDPGHGAQFPSDELMESDLIGASGDSSVQTYCWAMGLALSPFIAQFEPGNSILERWLKCINTAAFVSQGMLRFVPYGDENITGNGRTWIAPVQAVAYLTDDDFVVVSDTDEPVVVALVDPITLPTIMRAEVLERGEDLAINQYQPQVVEARDLGSVVGSMQRVGTTESFHEICSVEMGAMVVQTLLQRARYAQSRYKFNLDWSWVLLDPMDVVAITVDRLGFQEKLVRILDIEEDDNGLLSITAEELTVGVSTPGPNPSTSTVPTSGNIAVAIDPVNAVLIYEPPPGYTNNSNGGIPQIWFGASGGVGSVSDPNWGGAYVWASVDGGTSYTRIGKIIAPLAQGTLTANLASLSGFDTTNTLAVDLSESGQNLDTITDGAAQAGGNLCLVNSELMAFASASLSGTNRYNLTRIQRGFYGTTPALHTTGASFAQLDNALKMDLPQSYIGVPIKFKFQGFNKYGQGIEDLSTCTPYSYTPNGQGQGGVQISSVSETLVVSIPTGVLVSSIQIPVNGILLGVKTENLTAIGVSGGSTGYQIDPVLNPDGTTATATGRFGTNTLASAAVVNTVVTATQWLAASSVLLTATGGGTPQFTSGNIKITLRYMTV
jgi:hypothetical protein